MGIDFGDKRIGIAVSDADGILATPYETIQRVGDHSVEHGLIMDLVAEADVDTVVIGMPYSLDGERGLAASKVEVEQRGLVKRFRRSALEVEVHNVDERFTTVTAHQSLRRAGMKGRKQRDVVDSVAASVLLQAWLDGRDREVRFQS